MPTKILRTLSSITVYGTDYLTKSDFFENQDKDLEVIVDFKPIILHRTKGLGKGRRNSPYDIVIYADQKCEKSLETVHRSCLSAALKEANRLLDKYCYER